MRRRARRPYPRPSIVMRIAGQPLLAAVYGPVGTVVCKGSGRGGLPHPNPARSERLPNGIVLILVW